MKLLILLVIISLIVMLIYKLFKSMNLNVAVTILCTLLVLQIVLTPKLCMDSAISGAKLFFNSVFPSLFPFLVVINIIIAFDGIMIYSKVFGNILCKPLKFPKECSFALIVSIFCGYPLGAKYTCELYEKKLIDQSTAERLLNTATNASPLFVIGAVGTAMLGSTKLGYLLLISNILSCVFMGIILPKSKISSINKIQYSKILPKKNIGNAIRESIEDSLKTAFMIGGFIIIFSILTNIIKNNALIDIVFSKLPYSTENKFIALCGMLGLLEMTNGAYLISTIPMIVSAKLALISFLISFSGLSIISQVYSFTYKYNLSMRKYIVRKLIQGIVASVITILLYNNLYEKASVNAINILAKNNNYNFSTIYIVILIFFILPWITSKFIRLLHIS